MELDDNKIIDQIPFGDIPKKYLDNAIYRKELLAAYKSMIAGDGIRKVISQFKRTNIIVSTDIPLPFFGNTESERLIRRMIKKYEAKKQILNLLAVASGPSASEQVSLTIKQTVGINQKILLDLQREVLLPFNIVDGGREALSEHEEAILPILNMILDQCFPSVLSLIDSDAFIMVDYQIDRQAYQLYRKDNGHTFICQLITAQQEVTPFENGLLILTWLGPIKDRLSDGGHFFRKKEACEFLKDKRPNLLFKLLLQPDNQRYWKQYGFAVLTDLKTLPEVEFPETAKGRVMQFQEYVGLAFGKMDKKLFKIMFSILPDYDSDTMKEDLFLVKQKKACQTLLRALQLYHDWTTSISTIKVSTVDMPIVGKPQSTTNKKSEKK